MSEHVDVLIVGAGLSGIGAAHHIQAAFPDGPSILGYIRDTVAEAVTRLPQPGTRARPGVVPASAGGCRPAPRCRRP